MNKVRTPARQRGRTHLYFLLLSLALCCSESLLRLLLLFQPFKCANANKLQPTALKETLNSAHTASPTCAAPHTEGCLFHLTLKLFEPPLQLVVVEGGLARESGAGAGPPDGAEAGARASPGTVRRAGASGPRGQGAAVV